MIGKISPERWANDITVLLRTVFGGERFPVDVKLVAHELTAQRFPDDPITLVRGDALPGFEGALVPAPTGKKGWGIFYNNDISSPGRINFTLGHEFGHYLLHRLKYPKGFQCSGEDMASWDSEFGQLEHQANVFAATLMMPLDDFRRQVGPRDQPGLDELRSCAGRYAVSLIAATLRWLQFTERRAVLVVSNDGFINWARSSQSAFTSGLFFKTRDRAPIELSPASLAAQRGRLASGMNEADHDRGVWHDEPCRELLLFSDHHDWTISLLHYSDGARQSDDEDEYEPDTYDRMISRGPGQSWLL